MVRKPSRLNSRHPNHENHGKARKTTAINETDDALQKSEIRNRALLAAIPDMIFVFDRNGTYIDYRAAAQSPLVIPAEQLIGNKLIDLMPPDVSGPAMACIRQALETGETQNLEYSLEFEGKPMHFEARLVKMNDSSVICVSRDITVRKQAGLTLQENERKLATLMNNLPGIVYYCANDPDWTMEYISQGSLAFTGYAPESLIGNRELSYNDIIHPDDQAMVFDAVQKGVDNRSSYSMEYRIITRDGTIKNVWEQGKGAFDDHDRLVRLEGLIIDISEQKLAEMERDRLQQLLTSIIDSMPSILITLDRQGLVTRCNAEAVRQADLSLEQVTGLPVENAIPWLSGIKDIIRRSLDEQSIQYVEHYRFSRNNETRYAEIIIYPLISAGFEGAVLRIDDITEKVLLQEMIIQTEKIMTVGGLAAGIAHEINNPLSGILQAAQNIQRRISPEQSKNQQTAEECGTSIEAINAYMMNRGVTSFIKGIQESGERAASIMNKMLEFSRRSTEIPVPADLPTLVDRAVELAASDYDLQKGYDFRHIRVNRAYDPSLGAVLCFPGEIEQVVLNLLKNAAHAMTEGDPPVNGPLIDLHIYKNAGMAVIEVKDNGPGMSPEVLKRVFEPFFTTKAPGVGTGLGLSVSYYIVTHNHNGKMTVISSPGKGTAVSVSIPL